LKNCGKLCNYLELLIDSISEFSFRVNNKNLELEYANKNQQTHPFLGEIHYFKENFSRKIREFLENAKKNQENIEENRNDINKAYIYPLLQISDANINIDETVNKILFEKLSNNSEISLAVGYFNLTKEYMNSIVKNSKSEFDILVSSPEANGFFNSNGFSNNIPKIYSHLEENFFNFTRQNGQQDRINIHEYKRDNWSKYIKCLLLLF
jgi:CDP-diacylglycerol--glycerol-3-phosphate 3-phosphatidyltransferase